LKEKRMGVKVAMDFSPDKYGMTLCPSCLGKGYSDESMMRDFRGSEIKLLTPDGKLIIS